MFHHGDDNTDSTSEAAPPIKKIRCSTFITKGIQIHSIQNLLKCHSIFLLQYRRAHIPNAAENVNFGDRSHKQCETPVNQQPRAPFSILAENLPDQHEASSANISRNGNVFKLNWIA